AGAGEHLGGPKRGDDELVEVNALRLGEPYAILDLLDRPAPGRRAGGLADAGPTFRSEGVVRAFIGTARGGAPIQSLARSPRGSLARGSRRVGERHVAKEACLLLVIKC